MLNEANHEPLEVKKSQEEIHSKEHHLKRELEGYYILHNKIIKLLKDDSITDHDKIETLKNYFIT